MANCIQQNSGLLKARQVKVAGIIFDKLSDSHMIAAPKRNSIQIHAQAGCRKTGHQELIAAQLSGGTFGNRFPSVKPDILPFNLRLWTRLYRNQQPLVSLWQPDVYGAVCGDPLGLGLSDLVW